MPAMPLVYIAGTVAVMIDRESGTTRSAEADAAGDGWTQAHRVTAVDLVTGDVRWEGRIDPGSTWALPGVQPWDDGVVVGGPDARYMAVVAADGGAQAWDLSTGKVAARINVGPYTSWSYALAFPGLLVVSSPSASGPVVTGWDLRLLAVRWQVHVPNAVAWPAPCGRLLCMNSEEQVWGLDIRTGAIAWHARGVSVHPAVLPVRRLAGVDTAGPVTIDAATGDVRPLDGGWRIVDSGQRRGRLVTAQVGDDGAARLGLLSLGTGAVTDLGPVGTIMAGIRCQADDTHIACGDGGQLRVWRLRG
jgi:hypothetical protein